MANNEILPFAGTDTGTNLLTQAEYNADSQRPIGNQPGVARSKLVNKVLRQTSLIAAAVAQFLANRQANDITDSLTPATLAGYFLNVIGGDIQKSSFNASAAGGTVDAITGTFTPAITALSNGLSLFIRASGANTAAVPTFTPNSETVTAKAIVKGANRALVAGDIAGAGHWIELQYDSTLDKWVLQNPAYGINSQSAGNFAGLNSYNASATLPLSDLGKLVAFYGSTAAQTLTLPAVATVAVGKNLIIVNQASVAVTIKGNAAENISRNIAGVGQTATNTLLLNPGDSIIVSSNGSNQWYCYGRSAQDGFINSLGTNGYQKLPNGLIIQWGKGASGNSGTITYPMAFPNAILNFNILDTIGTVFDGPINPGLTMATWSGNGAISPYWMAIGY